MTTRHAAFLRAINVGGRRVTNDELTSIVSDAGYDDVDTFLASGNVLLDLGGQDEERATAALERALSTALGYLPEVFLRSPSELDEILGRVPFEESDIDESMSKPQIGLFRAAVDSDAAEAVAALSTVDDLLLVQGRELHWLPKAGMARAAFNPATITDLVGPVTIRTRNTIVRIRPRLD